MNTLNTLIIAMAISTGTAHGNLEKLSLHCMRIGGAAFSLVNPALYLYNLRCDRPMGSLSSVDAAIAISNLSCSLMTAGISLYAHCQLKKLTAASQQ